MFHPKLIQGIKWQSNWHALVLGARLDFLENELLSSFSIRKRRKEKGGVSRASYGAIELARLDPLHP